MRQTELLWRTAQTYYEMKDYARSEQLAEEAVTLARATRLPKLTYLATATLGEIQAVNDKAILAIVTLKDAVGQVEALRDHVAGQRKSFNSFFKTS